jgi:4-amino-4-deoxy-L-arabinose transferase-like glycosyltransferase
MGKLKELLPVAALIGLCALIFSLRLHTYNEPLERDLTTYAVIAHEMLNGKNLYSDLWDHKPPATHVTYAAAETIAGYGKDSILLMNVVAAIATLLICYWAGSSTGGGRIAGCLAATFWTLVSGNLALEANQPNTEVFMNVFLAAAFTMLVRAEKKNLGTRGALIVGILFAVASLYKQVVIIQPALLGIAYVFCCEPKFRKRAFADVLVIGATGIAIWGLVLGYFFARGSGPAFVESVFGYNRYYSSDFSHQALHNFKGWMALSPEILVVTLPMAVLAAFGIVCGVTIAPQRRWILLLAYLIASEIAVLLPGWPFPHYYQLLLPPLAIGAAWSVQSIRSALPQNRSFIPIATGALACGIMIVGQLPNYFISAEDWSVKKYGSVFVETDRLAAKIDSLLSRDETFYEWGSESGLYFASGRRPPSGIFFAFPMLGGPLKEKLSRRLVQDLSRARPDLIVADVATMTLTDREHPVLIWFRENYETLARTDSFLLFARKGSRLSSRSAATSRSEDLHAFSPQLSEPK